MISEVQVWDAERGTRTLTREEFIREFGAIEWQETFGFDWPDVDPATLPESQRTLLNRMQAEEEVNDAAAAAGIESIFDLPSEDDGESIPLDDLGLREHDAGEIGS